MKPISDSCVERSWANVRGEDDLSKVVRVSTDWPRETFFEEYDRLLAASDFRNEYALSQAAGISHSTLSSWRSGRQRPSTKGLAAIARELGVTALELWELAGLVTPGTAASLGVTEEAASMSVRSAPPELAELTELYDQLDQDGRQAVRTQLQMAITWARGQLSPE